MIVTANENYINVIMNLSAEDPFACRIISQYNSYDSSLEMCIRDRVKKFLSANRRVARIHRINHLDLQNLLLRAVLYSM